MLTINQISKLLAWNEQELARVLQAIHASGSQAPGQLYIDLHRLQNHRIVLKDCLIELLSIELTQAKAA